MLGDDSFARQVDRLPFAPNVVVVALGESNTDSLQSWIETVRHLLALRRPDDGIELVNSGISALTTQTFTPFVPVLAQQPDWIFFALGANDALRVGLGPTKTLDSLDETTQAQWVWLTRMPIDAVRMEAHEPFRMAPVPFVWRNPDLEATDAWIGEHPELIVDIYAGFGSSAPREYQEPNSLHPTMAGHRVMAREFVARLEG